MYWSNKSTLQFVQYLVLFVQLLQVPDLNCTWLQFYCIIHFHFSILLMSLMQKNKNKWYFFQLVFSSYPRWDCYISPLWCNFWGSKKKKKKEKPTMLIFKFNLYRIFAKCREERLSYTWLKIICFNIIKFPKSINQCWKFWKWRSANWSLIKKIKLKLISAKEIKQNLRYYSTRELNRKRDCK